MIPTVEQVKTRMRALLDDDAGAVFTDAVFTEAFGEAYDALFNAFLNHQCPRIEIIASVTITPGETSLVPSTEWPDFSSFKLLEERALGSTNKFTPLQQWDKLPQRDPTDRILDFVWRYDTFYFVGVTAATELRVTYDSSGTAPSTGSINVDGCLTFLAKYAAGVAGPRKGYEELANRYFADALGPRYQQGVIGGELWRIIQPRVVEMQHVQLAQRPYSAVRGRLIRRSPYIAAQQPQGVGMAPAQFSSANGTITGTIDGTNATFFLSYPVATANVFRDGVLMTQPGDVTFGANVIVFQAGQIPQVGDVITVEGWV